MLTHKYFSRISSASNVCDKQQAELFSRQVCLECYDEALAAIQAIYVGLQAYDAQTGLFVGFCKQMSYTNNKITVDEGKSFLYNNLDCMLFESEDEDGCRLEPFQNHINYKTKYQNQMINWCITANSETKKCYLSILTPFD